MSPNKQEKLFHIDYAYELFRIAEGDFKTSLSIARDPEARLENAFFMIQQSLEKVIKAVLVKKQIAVPLVHDLGVLLAKLTPELQPPYGYELSELNQYASIRRYEEGQFDLTVEEFEVVKTKASEMLKWGNDHINSN
ncbi:MAG: HEPN domain-containing protein [Acidobacteriota bacterium]